MRSRGLDRRRHEDHVNHEAWAIPYADLLTLLLAFFVVMYAISNVNAGKYRAVSESLNEAFHGSARTAPIEAGTAAAQRGAALPINQVERMFDVGLPATALLAVPPASAAALAQRAPAATLTAAVARSATAADGAAAAPATAPATAPAIPDDTGSAAGAGVAGNSLERVTDAVTAAMHDLITRGQVRVHRYGNWVAVDISADMLFHSGAAQLAPPAVGVLQKLADALKSEPNAVRVEGHTDDQPIRTAAFPSNWELSAARAASVVHLFMDRGIAADRLAVIGFGQYRPIATNQTAAGRNTNRRVVVAILAGPGTPAAAP